MTTMIPLLLALATVAPEPTPAPESMLGPGDVLLVALPGEAPREVSLGWDGTLDLGVVGRIPLAGTNPEALQPVVRGHLSKYFRATDAVVVRLAERRRLVQVTGAVRKPGAVLLRPGDDLLGALAAAGGHTDDADLRNVRLQRAGVQATTVDARSLMEGETRTFPALLGGDVLVVPEAPAFSTGQGDRASLDGSSGVLVLGAVRQPGLHPVPTGGGLATLIASAGGPAPGADVTAILVRNAGGGDERVSLLSVGGPALGAGGVVFVPSRTDADDPGGVRVSVVGGPKGGLRMRLPAGARLADAIAAAGAGDESSRLSRTTILRRQGENTVSMPFDLGDPSRDAANWMTPLFDGDVVRVEPTAQGGVEVALRYVAAIGSVAATVLLVWTVVDRTTTP